MNNDAIADAILESSELTQEERVTVAIALAAQLRTTLGVIIDSATMGHQADPRRSRSAVVYATALHEWMWASSLGDDRYTLKRLEAHCEAVHAQGVIYQNLSATGHVKRKDKAQRIWRKTAEEACSEAHRELVRLIRLKGETDDE